jgi:hypothetical protein
VSTLPQINIDGSLKKYFFTDGQKIQADMLSPETFAKFETMRTEIIEELIGIEFTGSPEQIADRIKQHAMLSGQRLLIEDLLMASVGAYAAMAQPTTPGA